MRRVGVPVAAALALAVAATVSVAGNCTGQDTASSRPLKVAVSPFLDQLWGDDATRESEKASTATGSWNAAFDLGSLYNVTRSTGAQAVWSMNDPAGRKITGAGVTVALIDTGIAPVAGLTTLGKVVNGPDLSFDGQSDSTRYLDGFGHGTFMAGIIAGRDAGAKTGKDGSPSTFVGMAPGATLLNVKVAAADGGVDVTQVIAAIDWVVQHRHDNGMDVRVLNLSYGTSSAQAYTLDPLAKAVENAWAAGIVVVVAAGNDGGASALNMPAADPYVLAVGASDHNGTVSPADDTMAAFTNPGTASRRPDLLAPGKSVVSLRVPGSFVDMEHPEGLVAGDTDARYFRGSGTSQATAVVSGAVALLLQARPSLTPDQVKLLLQTSADPMPADPGTTGGPGELDIRHALGQVIPSVATSLQSFAPSTGLGSLELSRGDSHVVDPATGIELTGDVDALGAPWDSSRWSTASTLGAAWTGGVWNSSRWSGDAWSGTSWSSSRWSGMSWSGIAWQSYTWASEVWSSSRWSSSRWSSSRWSSSRWSSSRWSSSRWSSSRWSSSRWSSSHLHPLTGLDGHLPCPQLKEEVSPIT